MATGYRAAICTEECSGDTSRSSSGRSGDFATDDEFSAYFAGTVSSDDGEQLVGKSGSQDTGTTYKPCCFSAPATSETAVCGSVGERIFGGEVFWTNDSQCSKYSKY